MSSLADELLDDLDGLSGGEDEQPEEPRNTSFKVPGTPASAPKRKHGEDENMSSGDDEGDEKGGLVLEGGVKPSDELDQEDVEEMDLGAVTDVRNVAKLEGSKRMQDILKVNTQ
jgi:U4/U6 small nuclear ribonucleoprotein PRP31